MGFEWIAPTLVGFLRHPVPGVIWRTKVETAKREERWLDVCRDETAGLGMPGMNVITELPGANIGVFAQRGGVMGIRSYTKTVLGHYKGIEFRIVRGSDFHLQEGPTPSWMHIIDTLEKIGGGGWDGVAYQRRVLEAAGWNYRAHGQRFTNDLPLAVIVLNHIRGALAQTTDPRGVFDHL